MTPEISSMTPSDWATCQRGVLEEKMEEPEKKLIITDEGRYLSIGGERIHLCPSCLKRYLGLD